MQRRIIVMALLVLLILGCTRPAVERKEGGLTEPDVQIVEDPDEIEEPIVEEVEIAPEPVIEEVEEVVPEEPEEDIIRLHKREYNHHPQKLRVFEHTRKTRGIPRSQFNEDVCTIYKYSLDYLEVRQIFDLYSISCKTQFVFFGIGEYDFINTFTQRELGEFIYPKGDLAKADQEFALLLQE